ncbi:tellurium resistance protein TerD [Helicobacter bizzozeronii CIII-1]|uniref:Tellurium resistance protein TerD n=1 Tax=Helicobacter bizzozeronii (strain CIII-1) TaxID=1002804 RepID=F8KSX7_HELBC|nr:tellurium resistance protein TerD [Helicobacter bizzozeronii CIII-1]
MSVSLVKGGRVSLSKEKPGLSHILVGLGWDVNASDTGVDFDLDASVFLTDASGKVNDDKNFVFYNNLTSKDGSVVHTGDNRTGEGEGDDESIKIDLAKVSSDCERN